MTKQWVLRGVLLAALVCLIGVGVQAQDVASTSNSNGNISLFSAPVPSTPAPSPAPRPVAGFLTNGGLDIFAGYSYLDNGYPNSCGDMCDGRSHVHGYHLSVTKWLNSNFGVTADISGHNGSP